MGDCRFNPQLLGYVCSRSFQHSLFLSVFIIASLSARPLPIFLMHAYVVLKVSFSGEPFLPLLIHSLLLFLPCSLLPVHYFSRAVKFSDFLQPSSPTTAVCLYMAISYLVRQVGGGRKQPISLPRSPWTHFSCVYVCVRACVQERERGRQKATASSHGDT